MSRRPAPVGRPGGHPRILGVAGGGLDDAAWAVSAEVAKIGQHGERKTAALLNRYAASDRGVTVLHDLHLPIPGFSANIDHVVVSGRTVHIIDAKVWRPAFYWTLGARTRRGLSRFTPAEKQTMAMARSALSRYLDRERATFATPVVVVWPSSAASRLNVSWLRIPGATAMTAGAFERYAERTFGRRGKPADPRVVHALATLTNSSPRRRAG